MLHLAGQGVASACRQIQATCRTGRSIARSPMFQAGEKLRFWLSGSTLKSDAEKFGGRVRNNRRSVRSGRQNHLHWESSKDNRSRSYLCLRLGLFLILAFYPCLFTSHTPARMTAPPRKDDHVMASLKMMAATIMLVGGSIKRNAPVCAAGS